MTIIDHLQKRFSKGTYIAFLLVEICNGTCDSLVRLHRIETLRDVLKGNIVISVHRRFSHVFDSPFSFGDTL